MCFESRSKNNKAMTVVCKTLKIEIRWVKYTNNDGKIVSTIWEVTQYFSNGMI